MSTFGLSKIHYPCRRCGNLYQFNLDYVRGHLYRWGISKFYKMWTFYGEVTTPIVDMDPVNEVEQISDDEEDDTFFDMLNNLRDIEDNNENPSVKELGESYISIFEETHRELNFGYTNFSVYSFLLKLMHVKVLNDWSNKSFNMLLQLLREEFPKLNAIPSSHYETKKMLRELGLGYESIHVCKNDYILFWDEHEGKDTCLTRTIKKIPQKVLPYFSLKPRLKRLFLSKHIARDLRWHKEKRVETNRVLRHPADVEAWKGFDKLHEIFADNPRYVHLGLAIDGFNPFRNMSNVYSILPVLLVLNNLPPWKMMKLSYMIMSLLISGPKAPGKEIDVHLHPLINELNELWTYRIVSEWSTKGYNACPVCLEDTVSQRLHSKICYTGHHRFLHDKHSWRKNKRFNGKFESEGPPRTFNGSQILTQLDVLPEVTFVGDTNWVKKLIFFELEYWSDLKLRHNLDIMHIEKNICDALDTVKARLDIQDMGIRSELHLKKIGDRVSKPHASYIFTLEERREFCQFLKSVKFPDGYAANISRKKHDCHVLLQRLLPITIRNYVFFFKKLSSRTLHVVDLKKMEEDIVFILCKIERIFPLAFFDIMVHLAVYLPHEAILARPISSRWMYPFERYLGTLKKYIRNMARPEGSIVEGYVVNEALTFSSLYMSQIETRFTRPNHNKDATQPILFTLSVFNQQVRVMGSQRNHKLPLSLRKKAYWYVINNCKEVDRYRK
ncbi:hypothetical protein Pfo_000475 [Paulownia fortunei]|nr:hypothetical protein Pfo_000475 [Paulownia fortunei]